MKVTLDHRCILHLADRTPTGKHLAAVLRNPALDCRVVNIADAAMRGRGVRPEAYGRFEELLAAAGVAGLTRLDPMFVVDVTFWGRCVIVDEDDVELAGSIGTALFGEGPRFEVPEEGIDSPVGRRWLQKHCDVQALWCHLHYGSEAFLTPDEFFRREERRPGLAALGAGRICLPFDL
jgi:hypothetical protein